MNTPAPSNEPANTVPIDKNSTVDAPESVAPVSEPDAPSAEPPKICLDQFLKTCGVETGGQAKRMIQGGEVLVNNEIETRRRRKLVPGDEVQLYEDVFVVALAEPEPDELELAEPEANSTDPATGA